MVVCSKTFYVLSNQKLITKDIRQNGDHANLYNIRVWCFEKMFYSQKHEKLFIKTDFYGLYSDHMLVFDMKNDFFYFHQNVLHTDRKEHRVFAARKDGEVYSVAVQKTETLIRNETRSLKFVDGKQLVDGKVEWSNFERKNFDASYLWAACYV